MLLNSDGTDRIRFVKAVMKSQRKDVYGSVSLCSPQATALPQLRNSSEILPHMFLFREALQTPYVLTFPFGTTWKNILACDSLCFLGFFVCLFAFQCHLDKQTCISDMC